MKKVRKDALIALILCFVCLLFANCDSNNYKIKIKSVDAVMVGKYKAITRDEVEKEIEEWKYDLKTSEKSGRLDKNEIIALELIEKISIDDCMDYLKLSLDDRLTKGTTAGTKYPDIYFLDEECCFLWGVTEQGWAYQDLVEKIHIANNYGFMHATFSRRGDVEALKELKELKLLFSE